MQNLATQLDTLTLKRLEPLNALDERQLSQITNYAVVHRLQPSESLLLSDAERESGKYVDYLISGNVELSSQHTRKQLTTVHQKSTQPLSNTLSNYCAITAQTSSVILRIEKKLLESTLRVHIDQVMDCEELQVEADMHSMSQLLQNRCLLALPPDNIETVLALMETVEFSAGDYVINQGDMDTSYYTILSGRCRVTRRPHDLAREIPLAELGPGASFGEEALIAGIPRNANIQMVSDGSLMRLEKKYFIRYVVNPLISQVNYRLLIDKLRNGAKLIDVRNSDEFRRNGHGLHIPLPMLRLRLEKLSKGREYIFCCNDGKLSTTAAFLGLQQGFTTAVLKGGLDMVPPEYLRKNPVSIRK